MYNYLTARLIKCVRIVSINFRAICLIAALALGASGFAQTSIVSLTPNYGTPSGNTAVTITGNNFLATDNSTPIITTVNFGSVSIAYPNFVISTTNIINVNSPTQNAGIVDVILTTNTGNVSPTVNADKFVYDTVPVYSNAISRQNVTVNTAYSTLTTA